MWLEHSVIASRRIQFFGRVSTFATAGAGFSHLIKVVASGTPVEIAPRGDQRLEYDDLLFKVAPECE